MAAGACAAFLESRDFILKHRTDYGEAIRQFHWPVLAEFNWALDYFDRIAAANERPALHIVEEDGTEHLRSFAQLSANSNRVANYLASLGATRGHRLMLMLGNEVALWEILLAAIKLGVVVTPATTLLTTADLQDRVERGHVRHVVVGAPNVGKFDGVRGSLRESSLAAAPPGGRTMPSVAIRAARSSRMVRPPPAIRCCCISRPAPPPNRSS